MLEIWLPQIRHKHSNDLLSKDIKCLQLPVDLCELAPFWKQNLMLLYNHMEKYSCSCLTRPQYFLPGEVHEKPGFHLQFYEISGFQLLHGSTVSHSYPLLFGSAHEMQYVEHQPSGSATDEGLYSAERRFAIPFYHLETRALPTNPGCFSTSKFHSTSVVSLLMKLAFLRNVLMSGSLLRVHLSCIK